MVKYIYFGDKFLKPNGRLDPCVFTDKVHPNTPGGFRIWDARIYTIVQEWLQLAPIANTPPPAFPLPVPADLGPATPVARNDWLFRHNRILSTPMASKEKCQLLFLGDQVMNQWDRAKTIFESCFYSPATAEDLAAGVEASARLVAKRMPAVSQGC